MARKLKQTKKARASRAAYRRRKGRGLSLPGAGGRRRKGRGLSMSGAGGRRTVHTRRNAQLRKLKGSGFFDDVAGFAKNTLGNIMDMAPMLPMLL